MNTTRAVLVALVLAVSSACDPVYPLFLRNGLDAPITVQATFKGDAPTEAVLQTGERLAFVHHKREIERIAVIVEGRTLYELDGQAILKMLKSVPDPRRVTWSIQPDGIEPLSQSEIKQLYSPGETGG